MKKNKIYRNRQGKLTIYDKERYLKLITKNSTEEEKKIMLKELESVEEGVEYEKENLGIVKSKLV